MKTAGTFFSAAFIGKIQDNCKNSSKLKKHSNEIIDAASFWLSKSYDELWELIFTSELKRSHMVLSGGVCPVCKKDVHMYKWIIDPINKPWKLTCPHCNEMFPKNDFKAFYDSGLNEQGLFSYKKADRALLFNTEDKSNFGVDDGYGYRDEEGTVWWFIATYLVYGQWWGLIIDGLVKLGNAYIVTGELAYAQRGIILLDRIADVFPDFDYTEQGIMYEEERTSRGYVSYWGTTNIDIVKMALVYDQIFEAVKDDPEIVGYLNRKALQSNLKNKKSSFKDIQVNIETRIFEDILSNVEKFRTEYTKLAVTLLVTLFVLGGDENVKKAEAFVDDVLTECTTVDGVIGQKGSYSNITTQYIAEMLSLLNQNEYYNISKMLSKYPVIYESFRLHIDSWCLDKYYPGHGDDGRLGTRRHRCYNSYSHFPQQTFGIGSDLLNWYLYREYGNPAFLQSLYISNNYSIKGLFENDFNISDITPFINDVESAVSKFGSSINHTSVDKKKFKMALLHSGKGENKRSVFLDYDSGGMHSHEDALNIEIFAKGMHFLPDLGYPPVNCGGWSGQKFNWYKMPASHNVVVVDGKRHKCEILRNEKLNSYVPVYGKMVLWAIKDDVKAVCASCPEYTGTKRSERLLVLMDVSEKDAYIADFYRTVGGTDHARFIRNGFSYLSMNGFKGVPAPDYGYETLMRNFQSDAAPQEGWSADFLCDDRNTILEKGQNIHLKYTSLTRRAAAYTCESYVCEAWEKKADEALKDEAWFPTIMERVAGNDENTESDFVGIFEPYKDIAFVDSVKRLDITDTNGNRLSDMNAALEVICKNRRDIIISKDPAENSGTLCAGGYEMSSDLTIIRIVDGTIDRRYDFEYEKGWADVHR